MQLHNSSQFPVQVHKIMHALALGFRNAATVSIRSESYRRRCNALSPFSEIPGASLTTNRTGARDFDVNEERRERERERDHGNEIPHTAES